MSLFDNLSTSLISCLEKDNGIKTPEQAILTKNYHYLRVLNIPTEEITTIKSKAAHLLLPQGIVTAKEIYEKEILLGKLSSGCKVIDEYLNGGLRFGSIVEIFGESGCGKTQIALQFTSQCWEKGAVYISTENTFPSKRLQQMFCNLNTQQTNKTENLSKYGEKIFILNIIELDELNRCINTQLPCLIEANKTISLVVIDSITGPFRSEFQNDMKARAQHLKSIGVALMNLAAKYSLVILCLNQVLSSMNSDNEDVIPCLGLTWSNLLTSRFKVEKIEKYCRTSDIIGTDNDHEDMLQIRQMKIIASPELSNMNNLEYVITHNGVIGLKI